jgi:hypothetical protein
VTCIVVENGDDYIFAYMNHLEDLNPMFELEHF